MVSGSHHIPFLEEVEWATIGVEAHLIYLDSNQKGGECPILYRVAKEIVELFNEQIKALRAMLQEDVDVTKKIPRRAWLQRKNGLLGQFLGGVLTALKQLEDESGDSLARAEVQKLMTSACERWEAVGKMKRGKLVRSGWVDRPDV